MRDVMESPRYLDIWRAKLAPGDPAFDFELPQLETAETVRLSSFAGKQPVALVFGSYT
jgi:peroxiredoxin